MSEGGIVPVIIVAVIIVAVVASIITIIFFQSRKGFREQKNYERSLKMVPLLIHLPPPSDDIDAGARDQRDVADEVISQAQTMYNVISSTATKGFKSNYYGQRHISFELIAHGGLIHYYVVVPMVLLDTIRQSVVAAYPTARLEEVEEINLFSEVGKISGTVGGEFNLKKEYSFPIATYQESKRDAMRALLSALSTATRDDGVGIQIMIRPATEGWTKIIERRIKNIREGKKGAAKGKSGGFVGGGGSLDYFAQLVEVLWKPPHSSDKPKDTSGASTDKSLSGADQAQVEAMEDKIKYAGYEVLVRLVASSNTVAKSQALMNNVISAFAMFDSPTKNGFTFTPTRDIESFVTSYIFRFFPPEIRSNVLNTVELATLFHLPDQNNIPSSQVERQKSKQVDGPTEVMDRGFLLGYNVFRGVKKPIRLNDKDRRRHVYIIGQTGTGKSVLQENLALQDMLDNKGFALVDPHGDLAESLIAMVPKERVEDVIYFSPSDMDNPIGLNIFEAETTDEKDFVVGEMINMLYSLYDPGHTGIVGPRMENIVRNAALLLMSDPQGATFMDIPKCLVDPEFAKSKLPYVTDPAVLDFWTKEWPNAQRSNDAGEVTAWVVSKWAPFQTGAIRNVMGQIKSGFNIRDIMDNKKILLVNLSKGKLGEKNAQLLGMVFVMKFQQAAMSRANIPEEDRVDFTLYVDEFQNFATDSFESILSEARKYRLSLIVANQFMTQLTDKIREAIIGNVGTAICGRIGVTDAEQMVKRFQPTFDLEDLIKMPNYTSVAQVLINSVPSAPFSMDWIAPMGHPNQQLADALKRLSAAKYGRPRAIVEAEITQRLQAADIAREEDKRKRLEAMRKSSIPTPGGAKPMRGAGVPATAAPSGGKPSFLDDWLAKRQNPKPVQQSQQQPQSVSQPPQTIVSSPTPQLVQQPAPTAEPTSKSSELPQQSPNSLKPEINELEMERQIAPTPVLEPVKDKTEPIQLDTSMPSVTEPVDEPEHLTPHVKSQAEIEAEISKELRIARSQSISEMNEKKIIQADMDTANANGELVLSSDGADEIFIDVRGNIHQGNDE